MIVFKFGGASVKSADAIKNVLNIINHYKNNKILVIVSAMGKTTNLLEKILNQWKNNNLYINEFNSLHDFHQQIIQELFPDSSHPIYQEFNQYLNNLNNYLNNGDRSKLYYSYDRIVSFGEMISSRIIYHFLIKNNILIKWLPAPEYIITNENYKEANIEWDETQKQIQKQIPSLFKKNDIVLSQGFIGGTKKGEITTLGREGSDFSAAIYAYCLDAENITIWKDVPGLLNADPKHIKDTIKIDQISYNETIELAFYGASIIHPKTIKPLQNKAIPLFVKSFINYKQSGTLIFKETKFDNCYTSYILKKNQVLLSIKTKDFSFMDETNMSNILHELSKNKIKINTIQNSAITLSVCFDYDTIKLNNFLNCIKPNYNIRYNTDLELVTIRHYHQETIDKLINKRKILLEQYSRKTAQFVIDKKTKNVSTTKFS